MPLEWEAVDEIPSLRWKIVLSVYMRRKSLGIDKKCIGNQPNEGTVISGLQMSPQVAYANRWLRLLKGEEALFQEEIEEVVCRRA